MSTMTVADYTQYYGFSRAPFGKHLAPAQTFEHPGHLEAVARIGWLVNQQAIGLITGEVGVGKTLAARCAAANLDASKHTIIYVPNPAVGARGIHQQIVHALGVAPRFHRGALIAQSADLLARERDERNKTTILIIDEAHLLDADQLEQVRCLTNDQMDSASLLAIVLLGQPTLRRMVRRGSFAALDQRIAVRYQLPTLTSEQTTGYIRHHLKIAGRSDPLFADDAITAINHAAHGLPRQIGNIATAALIAGYTHRKTIIDHDSALAAIADHTAE